MFSWQATARTSTWREQWVRDGLGALTHTWALRAALAVDADVMVSEAVVLLHRYLVT